MTYKDFKSYEELVDYINNDDTFNYDITTITNTVALQNKLSKTHTHEIYIHQLFIYSILNAYSRQGWHAYDELSPKVKSSYGGFYATRIDNSNIHITDKITLSCTKLTKKSFPIQKLNKKSKALTETPKVQLNKMSMVLFDSWLKNNKLTGRLAIGILDNLENVTTNNEELYMDLVTKLWNLAPTKELHSRLANSVLFTIAESYWGVPLYEIPISIHLKSNGYERLNSPIKLITDGTAYNIIPKLKSKKLAKFEWVDNYNKAIAIKLYMSEHPGTKVTLKDQLEAIENEVNKDIYSEFLSEYSITMSKLKEIL